MANLSVTYAGIKLRNPFIISSSGLTNSVEKIKKLDNLGAGAVVLKSLFEEQITYETGKLLEGTDYPEAFDYVRHYARDNSLTEYLNLIREAKRAVNIPVIASINCISASEWMKFGLNIQEAGADAIELNAYILPVDISKNSADYEKIYLDLISEIKKIVKIPVIMKIGSNFTNLGNMISNLYYRNADAVVLFNRYYEPDINLHDMSFGPSEVFSSPSDIRNSLRWIGIISSIVKEIDISASTGVHSGEAAVKVILAGAAAVQVCSVLYKKGVEFLPEMIGKFEEWMLVNKYSSVDEFKGKMNYLNISDPAVYERVQFMKYFSSHD